MKNQQHYRIIDIPDNRIGTIDIGVASRSKHHINAMVEFDVTEARLKLKQEALSHLSFTAWLIKCISTAISEQKQVQGIRYKRQKIMVFEDVDVSIMVEREVEGIKVPLPYVIRKANEKSIEAITLEIRQAQKENVLSQNDLVLGEKKNQKLMKLYAKMPAWLRNMIWRNILKNPRMIQRQMGTVMVTSIGMMGKINGWFVPKTVHPVAFAVGSIVKKPGVVAKSIAIRDYLYVTITVDHDVIDGAPAVRMLSKLSKMIESGFGLDTELKDD